MAIKDIFDKGNQESDYVEIDYNEENSDKKILIEVERMGDMNDSERIIRKVRDGMVLLVKIKDLRDKDMSELKRSVEKIKRTTSAINGDITGIGDEWLLVTPSTAKLCK